jgi:hypothetical protein
MAGNLEPKPRFKKLTEDQVAQALLEGRPNAILKEIERLVAALTNAYFPDYEAEGTRRGALPELDEQLTGRWPIESAAMTITARRFNTARPELERMRTHWDTVHTEADLN